MLEHADYCKHIVYLGLSYHPSKCWRYAYILRRRPGNISHRPCGRPLMDVSHSILSLTFCNLSYTHPFWYVCDHPEHHYDSVCKHKILIRISRHKKRQLFNMKSGFISTVKSHFIVARLNGESRNWKINFNFSHLHCLDCLVTVAKKWFHLIRMVPLF